MRLTRIAGAGCALSLLVGCSYQSKRSGQGADYAKYVYALYDDPSGGATASTTSPRFPLNLAVAEIGELSPPTDLLESLRTDTRVFRRISGIPGISDGDFRSDPYAPDADCKPPQAFAATRVALRRLERLARDTGMDYLLLVGATVDSRSRPTPASILDLTIVGAYVVPSNDLSAQARASAILLDLRTERIVMTSSAADHNKTFAPSVVNAGAEDQLIRAIRDSVYQRLTHQFIADVHRRAGLIDSTVTPSSKGAHS